jgi:Mrp family chromosome partitioning ATPase
MDTMAPPARSTVDFGPLLAILFMMIDEMRSVVIHVTSVGPGEGTTTVARQIALAAAASPWCKVALLEARSGSRHILEGQAAGQNSGLVGRFERGETVTLLPDEGGIASGQLSAAGHSSPRIQSVRGLYGLLRSDYTLIVVCCPPVLSGQDAGMMASAADGTVLVVEAERTPVPDIIRAREVLEQLGASILGVVLNKRRHRVPTFLAKAL